MENDSIRITSKPNIVEVSGEVNSPGFYQFMPGKNMSDFIRLAGGFTKNADKNSFIIHANGQSKQIRSRFFSPRVFDGSRIVVPTKEISEPFNLTTFATNITSLYADITQILLVLSLVQQQS